MAIAGRRDTEELAMFDLVIRNGLVVDGTGAEPVVADVAINGDRIVAIGPPGEVLGGATREIDADGLVVTPGFVDIHTHFDGQATWDEFLEPATPHGVTTVVFGNCGVGFAPVRPDGKDELISLMEGVEDIPGTALSEGMSWNWETFEEYLDVLRDGRWTADVGAMIAHGPVRAYVMGERGVRNEDATADDIAQMAAIVESAILAGAVGFSTSRTLGHTATSGEPVPGTFAGEDEVFALARAVARANEQTGRRAVLEWAPSGITDDDHLDPRQEVEWMIRVAAETGIPVTFLLLQTAYDSTMWRTQLDMIAKARAEGHEVTAQVAGRPFGVLFSLQARHHFVDLPGFAHLVEAPASERATAMRDPELRSQLIAEFGPFAESVSSLNATAARLFSDFERLYVLGDPVDYEPDRTKSIAGIAEARGVEPVEALYDEYLARDGQAVIMSTLLGYVDGNGDALHDMLVEDGTVMGLADAGAHCFFICDASTPTWNLTHWVRDRDGSRIPLAEMVKLMTADTADLFGFDDRGRLLPGKRADLNVIDLEGLSLREPHVVRDLPAGGPRFLQHAEGYRYTIVAGEITRQDDAFTKARPGRLLA